MISFAVVLLACIGIIYFINFLLSRRRFYKVAWKLPGPWGLPFIGVGFQMLKPETVLRFLSEMSQKYKSPCISWMGTSCFLYVSDSDTIETIFNSSKCLNKGAIYRFIKDSIGDGLFTSNNSRWSRHRNLINPAFARQVLKNFLPILNSEANVLLMKIKAEAAEGKVEIFENLKKAVLEIACQTTMGKKMGFQVEESAKIFSAYNRLLDVWARRILSPWLHPDILYRFSPSFSIQNKVMTILRDFVENLLQQNDHHSSSNDQISDKGKSKAIFIEQMRKNVEQGHLTWEDIRDEANVTIAATFETTSTALYLVCLCLAIHPEHQDKLFDELTRIFPNRTDFNVTNEHLERMMPYTEMVINEAMRLFAPVPVVIRSATDDFRLRNGIVIPRGTQIAIDIFNMHRNETEWGPDALKYNPDNFLPEKISARHAFAFVPFTKGLRMCIGHRYAMMLMKTMLAKIFRNFRIQTDATLETLIVKGMISLKLENYPKCLIIERNQ